MLLTITTTSFQNNTQNVHTGSKIFFETKVFESKESKGARCQEARCQEARCQEEGRDWCWEPEAPCQEGRTQGQGAPALHRRRAGATPARRRMAGVLEK